MEDLSKYTELQDVLKSGRKIVYLFGAGFSIALGNHRQTWQKWIEGHNLQIPFAGYSRRLYTSSKLFAG